MREQVELLTPRKEKKKLEFLTFEILIFIIIFESILIISY